LNPLDGGARSHVLLVVTHFPLVDERLWKAGATTGQSEGEPSLGTVSYLVTSTSTSSSTSHSYPSERVNSIRTKCQLITIPSSILRARDFLAKPPKSCKFQVTQRSTKAYAMFSSEVNRQRSPLLRLPAELRNKIYGYALGGIELRMSYRSKELGVVSPMSYDPHMSFTPFHRLVGLTLVSRQIYAETKILPFELCTMLALGSTFNGLIERLNLTQRQAISTIHAHHLEVKESTVWTNSWPAVRLLTGLKRVEVFCSSNLGLPERIHIAEGIKKGLGRDDVDVLLEP